MFVRGVGHLDLADPRVGCRVEDGTTRRVSDDANQRLAVRASWRPDSSLDGIFET